MAVLPAEIPTGLVTGQFYFVSEDAADANTDPELEVVSGFVRFTSSAKVLRMPTKKATIVPLTFNAKFNVRGELVSEGDPSIGLKLPATDSDLINPKDYTWQADFFLRRASDGHTVQIPAFSFKVPAGGTVDLTTVMPVQVSNGVQIIQGPPGPNTVPTDKAVDAGLERANIPAIVRPVVASEIQPLLEPTVKQIAASYVASNPAVVQAAAAAVDANPKIAELSGAVETLYPRTVDERTASHLRYRADADLPYAVTDENDRMVFGAKVDGTAIVGSTETSSINEAAGWAYVITDESNRVAFGVRNDGTTSLSGGGATSAGYDLILAVGQSNQSGAGRPMNAETSPTHPRVFQFPSPTKPQYGKIIPAVEPLLHYGPIVGVTGTGPTMEFARKWADAHPDRKVLIVAAAKSGSGFTPTAGLSWQLRTTEPEPVARIAIQQAKDAVAAAGEGSRFVAITWVQGEADGALGGPTYQSYLDELFTEGFRAELGADIPIIIGQMNPDRTDTLASAREIDKVHMDTARRLKRTAFAYGPRGANNTDGVTHYSSRGTVLLGRSMFEAYQRAVRNDDVSGPAQVEDLRVERSFDKAKLCWGLPYSTVTGYKIEWTTDGTTWRTDGISRYHDLDPSATVVSSAPVTFRITVQNRVGESRPQTVTG